MILPNQLTILRIILTPIFLYLFLSSNPLLNQISLAVFIVAALTDWYDGWLARKFNYITNWGKFWDPLADKILTSTAFVGFYIIGMIPLWMVIIILVRDFVITILRAYADYKGNTFPTSLYAKWKTFLQMIFLYYLLIIRTCEKIPQLYNGNENIFKMLFDPTLIFIIMLFVTIITLHSGITYIYNNKNLIKRLFID
ncbi:MAG: CDP-diacylglycerol--glycerol-3-phosphate 3-phosphatidyltransferase [Ignavibacteriales bacterium CG12_big_fil_rev_8_21_14_0_65_30_8]|nr:MAG: CDP-diacylglycerol--glycerol-3-phosphate 3-phosphatidyltransferase [Ignavibacteriales bacterium CG12_big_fil_rev_8_21_14_0_65_30_8]